MSGGATPAGWYGDPTPGAVSGTKRWWDGNGWTDHTQVAPPPGPGPQPVTPTPTPIPPQPVSSGAPGPQHHAGEVGQAGQVDQAVQTGHAGQTGQAAPWPAAQAAGPIPQGPQAANPLPDLASKFTANPILTVAAVGLALCLVGLMLPWASADFLGNSPVQVRAGGGATVAVLLGTALGGFGVFLALAGSRNAIFTTGIGAALNLLVAWVNYADVRSAATQTIGSINIGIGLVSLLIGSVITCGASLAYLVLSYRSE